MVIIVCELVIVVFSKNFVKKNKKNVKNACKLNKILYTYRCAKIEQSRKTLIYTFSS